MKRQSPLKALKVAQMRCRAAVTITITGKAGNGKTTIAEYITSQLAEAGFNAALLESDDSVHTPMPHTGRDGLDNRFVLVAVEDSKVAYAAQEEEKKCDGNCEDCDGEDIPPILKAILKAALIRASRHGM